VTLSRQLGDLIYDYCNVQPRQTRHCLELAQRVYLSTGSHVQAMVCMVRFGSVETALEYADQRQCDATQLVQVRAPCLYLLTYLFTCNLSFTFRCFLVFAKSGSRVSERGPMGWSLGRGCPLPNGDGSWRGCAPLQNFF